MGCTQILLNLGDGDTLPTAAAQRRVERRPLSAGKSRGQEAAEWLACLFATRREWPSLEILKLAGERGLGRWLLFESHEVRGLPIRKIRRVRPDGRLYHAWRAAEGWPSVRVV